MGDDGFWCKILWENVNRIPNVKLAPGTVFSPNFAPSNTSAQYLFSFWSSVPQVTYNVQKRNSCLDDNIEEMMNNNRWVVDIWQRPGLVWCKWQTKRKNTFTDGGSTALWSSFTVCTVYTIHTVWPSSCLWWSKDCLHVWRPLYRMPLSFKWVIVACCQLPNLLSLTWKLRPAAGFVAKYQLRQLMSSPGAKRRHVWIHYRFKVHDSCSPDIDSKFSSHFSLLGWLLQLKSWCLNLWN